MLVSQSGRESCSQSVSQSTNYTYIDRGHMLQDNALTFDSDHAYIIPQKLIENGQYMNKNGLLAAILKICEILDGDHMLHLGK